MTFSEEKVDSIMSAHWLSLDHLEGYFSVAWVTLNKYARKTWVATVVNIKLELNVFLTFTTTKIMKKKTP